MNIESRMNGRIQRIIALIIIPTLVMLVVTLLEGCGKTKFSDERVSDVAYEIVEEENIPEPLMGLIKENYEKDFRLTYYNGKDFYIVVGYGKQPYEGYTIEVEDIYLADEAVYIETNLIGPVKEPEKKVGSFPYMVMKIDYTDKVVIFR